MLPFGGAGQNSSYGDLWAFDQRDWRKLSEAGPTPSDAGERLETDTWEWDGAKWKQVATEGPGGRTHFAMVYDSTRKQVVGFGGLGEGYKLRNNT